MRWIAGIAGGLIPDADVIAQYWADPALPWMYHRHMTHAYVMAPVMGALAALVLWCMPAFRRDRKGVLLAAIVGAATHAPLDLCTSYGTKVYWPFSLDNATLDLFPIIDPAFTLILLVGVVLAARKRSRAPALWACVGIALYAGAAFAQRERALTTHRALLAARGDSATRARVMPLPASLLAWRALAEVEGEVVADVLRLPPFSEAQVMASGRLPVLREGEVVGAARDPGRMKQVWDAFAHFADDWVARDPEDPARLGDMRFCVDGRFRAPWALRIGTAPEEPVVRWDQLALGSARAGPLWEVLRGTAPDLQPLPSK